MLSKEKRAQHKLSGSGKRVLSRGFSRQVSDLKNLFLCCLFSFRRRFALPIGCTPGVKSSNCGAGGLQKIYPHPSPLKMPCPWGRGEAVISPVVSDRWSMPDDSQSCNNATPRVQTYQEHAALLLEEPPDAAPVTLKWNFSGHADMPTQTQHLGSGSVNNGSSFLETSNSTALLTSIFGDRDRGGGGSNLRN